MPGAVEGRSSRAVPVSAPRRREQAGGGWLVGEGQRGRMPGGDAVRRHGHDPVMSGLDELTDGVGVDDADPVGEDADPVGVAVEEVLVARGVTATWG